MKNIDHTKMIFMDQNLVAFRLLVQWAFTGSKLTIETLEQGVKYVQS